VDCYNGFFLSESKDLDLLFRHWPLKAETETILLDQALGRVTARGIYSRNTVPPRRALSTDGIAVKEGDLLVEEHVCLTPVNLAVLAMGGIYQLEAIKKPKAVFILTGSVSGQNVEANELMIAALLRQWGAEAICFPFIEDRPKQLDQALDLALRQGDIILINGLPVPQRFCGNMIENPGELNNNRDNLTIWT